MQDRKLSQAEGVGVRGGTGALKTGLGVVVVFGVVEDGEGFLAVEGEARFELLPFAIVNLDGELLGAAVVETVGDAVLLFEVADFLFQLFALRSPWDQDRVGFAVDEVEFFGSGFELVGFEIG